MTPKERLLSLLSGEKVDRPPFICPGGMMSMAVTEVMERTGHSWPDAHLDPAEMASLTKSVHELADVENYGAPFCLTVEAESLGAPVDIGNKETEPHIKEYIIQDIEDLRLDLIDLTEGRTVVVSEAIGLLAAKDGSIPIIGNLTGPVTLATSLIEPLTFLRALRRERQAAHHLLTVVTKSLIDFGRAQVEAGADVMVIADPSATGEILGPAYFKEFALTYLNQIGEELEAAGSKTIVHICGQLLSVASELGGLKTVSLSVDSVVSLQKLRKYLKGKILMGNVSTQVLNWGSPKQVVLAGKTSLKSGADILAPACGISPKTPIRNLKALASVVNGRENVERVA